MLQSDTKFRVRYAETDQMGVVYYGNYLQYYEVGRVELMRVLGTSYKQMEDRGVMMPVRSASLSYNRPALYDEELTIRTIIKELPSSRMQFFYEIYNEAGVLIHTGDSTLVFVDKQTRRPCRCPEWFMILLNPYFQ